MLIRQTLGCCCLVVLGMAVVKSASADDWHTVTEDNRCIQIETDLLKATIPKNNPVHWMTGIEKHSFVDKTTGFHEAGDGLMVIDWLMEAGSDRDWRDQLKPLDRYLWHEFETDPARKGYARVSHGTTHTRGIQRSSSTSRAGGWKSETKINCPSSMVDCTNSSSSP